MLSPPSIASLFLQIHKARVAIFGATVCGCLLALGACPSTVKGPVPQTEMPRRDAGSPDVVSGGCNGECADSRYTTCTCAQGDPCGWANDGYCDADECSGLVSNPYDDSGDCGGEEDCSQDCADGRYTSCTCAPEDPCGWSGDGYCDENCEQARAGDWFDDSEDCEEETPPDCGSDCSEGRYTDCSCQASDPCSWIGDNYCDDQCAQVLPNSHFDDTDDCSSQPGDNTYNLTAVYDDLDNGDLDIMASGLPGIGYSQTNRDTDVSTAELRSYLQQNVTLHYHTGHGYEGQVVTNDGTLSSYDVTLAAQNTVFATCLTLQHSWTSAFGNTAQSVLGYTEISYDGVDNDVARDFLTELGNGRSFIAAWYLANNSQYSLSDRWAGYVREGSSIVEYSARTGNTPPGASGFRFDDVALDSAQRIWVAAQVLQQDNTFVPSLRRVQVQAEDPQRDMIREGWSSLAPMQSSAAQAEAIAREFVEGQWGMPEDAVLDRVLYIAAREQAQSGSVVGYTVSFARRLDGLSDGLFVRSNRQGHHISVTVGPEGVVAWSRYWPQLQLGQPGEPEELLTSQQAVTAVAQELSRSVKGVARIVRVQEVYGSRGPHNDMLVPAWELLTADGSRLVVNARDGKLLK